MSPIDTFGTAPASLVLSADGGPDWLVDRQTDAIDPKGHRPIARWRVLGHRKNSIAQWVWRPSRLPSEVALRAGGPILSPIEDKKGKDVDAHEQY